MATTSTSAAPLLSPEAVDRVLVRPLAQTAICMRPEVARQVRMTTSSLRLPYLSADPAVAVASEGAELNVVDATFGEVDLTPSKWGAVTAITDEAMQDSDGSAREQTASGLLRDIARKLDLAFFGTTVAGAPVGLSTRGTAGLAPDITKVTAATITNMDPFVDAVAAADALGQVTTAWVMNGTTLATLRKIKQVTGSTVPLLGTPAMGDQATAGEGVGVNRPRGHIFGIPVFVVPTAAVADNVIFGCSSESLVFALRAAPSVEADKSVFFTSVRWAVRGLVRAGWESNFPKAQIKISA